MALTTMIKLAAPAHKIAVASTGRCDALLHRRNPTAATAPVPAPLPAPARRPLLVRRSRTFLHRHALGPRHDDRMCRASGTFLWRLAGEMRHRNRPSRRPGFGQSQTFAIDREPDTHPRALAYAAADVEIAAMQSHQPFDDRQSETGAAMSAVIACPRLEIRLADAGEILLVDANAAIFDHERDVPGVHAGTDGDLAAAIGEPDRVGHEIDQNLIDRALVGDHVRQFAGRHFVERDARLAGAQRQEVTA